MLNANDDDENIDDRDENVNANDDDGEIVNDEIVNDENIYPLNHITNEQIQEFVGTLNNKPGWNNCIYCNRYHPPSMHLPGIEYCIHCWGWLNSNQLDLEKGTYAGLNSLSDVKDYLKKTFKLHDPTKCTINDCIYNKIIEFKKAKKLHLDFCVELNFIVKKQTIKNTKNTTNTTNTKNTKNKPDSKINFKLSYIVI